MRRLILPLLLCMWATSFAVFAQTFSINNYQGSFTHPDCSNLNFYADGSVGAFGYTAVTWKLLRDNQVIAQQVQPFWGFVNTWVNVTFSLPPVPGTYTMIKQSFLNNQTYPYITVTLARQSYNICPLGSYDGANCFYRVAPPNHFIYDNMFYVGAQRSKTCVKGWYDGANCYIMSKPSNGFIYKNSFYVTKTGVTCPAMVNGYPTGYDTANCYIFTAPWGTQAFEYHGGWYTSSLPTCPIGSFDGANCFVLQPPSGTFAFEYNGNWYTTPKWCT